MGGAKFFVRVPAQDDGFVLYLISYPVMGPLSSGLVANACVTFQFDASGDSSYLPVR